MVGATNHQHRTFTKDQTRMPWKLTPMSPNPQSGTLMPEGREVFVHCSTVGSFGLTFR